MKNIYASIITVGDELLIGQTIDTNSAWIAQQLNQFGILIKHRIAVADLALDIINAINFECANSDLIIITGGLGPTNDDITKQTLCDYFQDTLVMNETVLAHNTLLFAKRNRPMIEANIAQAMVPSTCTVLYNNFGTAPGMLFEKEKKIFISLPGVPLEMKSILQDYGFDFVKQFFTTANVQHYSLSTAGRGESFIAVTLQNFEASLPSNIKLAYLPKLGTLTLRLTGLDVSTVEIENYFHQLQTLVLPYCYANEDISLPEAVYKLLLEKNKTWCTAESCTGGSIADAITNIKGSSSVFKGSIIAYSNEVKINVLGVAAHLIERHTATSELVAIEMASQVLKICKTDYSISITGNLEKTEQEEAFAWIAVCNKDSHKSIKVPLPYDRIKNKELAVNVALNFLRMFILE
jgi:nicotinamide-nucleotide amidase